MNCTICGKQMNYTGFGNYRCQECGHAMNDLVNRSVNCDIPMPQASASRKVGFVLHVDEEWHRGWIIARVKDLR